MQQLPDNIYSVQSVRDMDRCAIEQAGIPGYELMTRAATAALDAAQRHFPSSKRWQIVCGPGNNGGDGYVLARLAHSCGIAAEVLAIGDTDALQGDAKRAHRDLLAGGGSVLPWNDALDPDADLIVDALLGSGLQRPVEGAFRAAIDAMNAHSAKLLALDIPSGMHGDTGEAMGVAVDASLTVTFVGLKAGLVDGQGRQHAGYIEFADLGIPASCKDGQVPVLRRITDDQVRMHLPARGRTVHKGDFGHVLVIGGAKGMPGAALLCGEAALRSGAGRVTVGTAAAHAAAIAAARPELMVQGIDAASDADAALRRADVIAIGPGLGTSAWGKKLCERVTASGLPSVWDADALNLLAEDPGRDEHRVLTPHPGEAGRLIGCSTATVQNDRRAALSALRSRYGGVVVLKGAGTLVSSNDGAPFICMSGNPGMAAPGMGDVLTGIIAALLAQGLAPDEAARAGVQIHATAGDRAATQGERGMLASDLMAELRATVNP